MCFVFVCPAQPVVAPPRPDEVVSTLQAVRKYNEEVMKGMVDPDAKPPLPLKKKTGKVAGPRLTSVYCPLGPLGLWIDIVEPLWMHV